jgi:uncharacterized protein (TIGR03437 family)
VALVATCRRSDPLSPGNRFPAITVTAQLANAQPGATGTADFQLATSSCGNRTSLPVTILGAGSIQLPAVTLVTNAASFITPGHSNYGIAPGSLISIFGNGIGPATPARLQSLPFPPSGFAGVHVQATVGGTTLDVPVYYASDGQVNALLPSQIPAGDGSLVVTFNGKTTSPHPIRVAATNVGIFATNMQGYGTGIFQNASPGNIVQTNTIVDPVRPGQIVILWATGLGGIQGDEFAGPLPQGLPDVPVEIYVGGKLVAPVYSGRSGCCVGTDQIHFVFPDDVQGCHIPVLVKAGDFVSNAVTMASSTDPHCTDAGGLTVEQVDAVNGGASLVGGTISFNRSVLPPNSANQDFALATFENLSQQTILSGETDFPMPVTGSCAVGQSRRDGQGLAPSAPDFVPADALSVFPFREKPPAYLNEGSLQIARGNAASPLALDAFERYTALLTSGALFDPGQTAISSAGSSPLGVFTEGVAVQVPPKPLGWQQPDSSIQQTGAQPVIDRTKDLIVNWSGGDPARDLALIAGFKTVTSSGAGFQGTTATSWFVCTAPMANGSFTVPSDVLQAMPTGLPSGGLPWIPGAGLNDVTTQKSYLSVGSIRKPEDSLFAVPGIGFGRLFYVLTTRQDADYR